MSKKNKRQSFLGKATTPYQDKRLRTLRQDHKPRNQTLDTDVRSEVKSRTQILNTRPGVRPGFQNSKVFYAFHPENMRMILRCASNDFNFTPHFQRKVISVYL